MIANDPYTELERRFGRMSAINRAGAILNWDRSTMMPQGASDDRACQQGLSAGGQSARRRREGKDAG